MLRQLNPDILFYESNNNAYRIAGVYLKKPNEYGDAKFLFGCPVDWIPDRTQIDAKTQRVVRNGWKDMIFLLFRKGLVRNRKLYLRLTRGWAPHRL